MARDAVLDISGDDGQVLGSGGHMTHAAGHTLALENTAREWRMRPQNRDGARSCENREYGGRTWKPQRLMVPAKPSTLGGAGHVDLSTLFEQISGQFLASLELIDVVGAHLDEVATRGDTGLGKVASQRLGSPWWIDGAVAELDSLVAVRFLGLHGGHHVGGHVDKSDGHEEAVLVPHLGHAELLPSRALRLDIMLPPPYSLILDVDVRRQIDVHQGVHGLGVGSTMSMRRL